MTRTLLLVLVLAGCSSATEPPPECPSADWCRHLENDVVRDSLLPWPDSVP